MLELSITRVSDGVHGIDDGLQSRIVFIHYLRFLKKSFMWWNSILMKTLLKNISFIFLIEVCI